MVIETGSCDEIRMSYLPSNPCLLIGTTYWRIETAIPCPSDCSSYVETGEIRDCVDGGGGGGGVSKDIHTMVAGGGGREGSRIQPDGLTVSCH